MSSPTSVSSSSTNTSLCSARARHVFGDLVLDVPGSPIGSLSYSPSSSSDRPSQVDKTRDNSPVRSIHPKVIDFVHDKENALRNNGKKVSFVEKKVNPSTRMVELNRLRMQSQSPKKRDLVKRTQDAINSASVSVNQSLASAHHAKVCSLEIRKTETAKLRSRWKGEKEEASEFHAEAEKNRQQLLALQKQLTATFRNAKNAHDRSEKQKELDAIAQESEFKSKVFRQHQQTLKEERDRRRRESADLRAKARNNHRAGGEELIRVKLEEDRAIHEERYAMSLANSEYRKQCSDERRKSFQFRAGDARRIRGIHAEMQSERQREEQESSELMRAAERDVLAHRKQIDEIRRKSLVFRNKEARKQREAAQLKQSEEINAEKTSHQLRSDGERDVAEYKKLLAEQKRRSLGFRNEEARKQREQHCQQLFLEMAQSHQSYELRWAGENDVKAYERKMEENRRKSLAGRHRESRKKREDEDQRQSQAQSDISASFELKFAADRDVDAYRKEENEIRRKSLVARSEEAHQRRNKDFQRQKIEQNVTHEGYELKWAGEKDAVAYQRQLEKARRESLCFRNQELVKHDVVMKELKDLALEKQHESYVLKWAAENDTKEYLSQIESERRKSLQLRSKEAKNHRELDDKAYHDRVRQAHEEEVLQAQARTDVEEYRKECAERDRLSLEFRRKEANIQRLEAEAERQRQREVNESNRFLEDAAWCDVQEFIHECQKRKRLSLAFRAREKRKHSEWEQREAARKLAEQSEDSRNRSLDRRYQEIARRKERTRIVLDTIRHVNCTFSTNSFAHM